jgi:hypothetical protein
MIQIQGRRRAVSRSSVRPCALAGGLTRARHLPANAPSPRAAAPDRRGRDAGALTRDRVLPVHRHPRARSRASRSAPASRATSPRSPSTRARASRRARSSSRSRRSPTRSSWARPAPPSSAPRPPGPSPRPASSAREPPSRPTPRATSNSSRPRPKSSRRRRMSSPRARRSRPRSSTSPTRRSTRPSRDASTATMSMSATSWDRQEPTLLAKVVTLDPIRVSFDVSETIALRSTSRAAGTARSTNDPTAPIRRTIEVAPRGRGGLPAPGQDRLRRQRARREHGDPGGPGRAAEPDGKLYPGLFARIRVPVGDPRGRDRDPRGGGRHGARGQVRARHRRRRHRRTADCLAGRTPGRRDGRRPRGALGRRDGTSSGASRRRAPARR